MATETDASPLTVSLETFESLSTCRPDPLLPLDWTCLFVLPPWLRVWWDHFGHGFSPLLLSVKREGRCLGLAPLMVRAGKARFIGSPDVCDFQEFVFPEGQEEPFLKLILNHLQSIGISTLELEPLRGDSAFFRVLSRLSETEGQNLTIRPLDVLLEMDLPASWEDFLQGIPGKERHEIRRKLRRLEESGAVRCRVVETADSLEEAMTTFLDLFRSSRPDKKEFMTERMASFFRSLAGEMAGAGLLRLYFLDLQGQPVASVLCFDYRSTLYLYNNGYDESCRALSLGLLSKIFTIQDGIRKGRRLYNFLRGAEAYKYRLGGKPVPLYQCFFDLTAMT
jgi:CelD/BcsL family acetyltransferase involved in cellulose biosynthesis